MKTCPHCAEPIQDAAVFCKHCRHDVNARRGTAAPSRARSKLLPIVSSTVLGVLAIVGGYVVFGKPALAALVPQVVTVPDNSALTLHALGSQAFGWTTTKSQCTVTGHIAGVAGGDRDVDVLVMTEDDYINWRTRPLQATPLYQSGRESDVTLNVHVVGPGTYRLVVSNRFSLLTPKTVQIQGVKMSCS